MLPQTVIDCLREREYFIGVGNGPTHFFMEIKEKYNPHNGNIPICSLTYDQRTDHLAMSDRNGLDERLLKYIQEVLDGFGRGEMTAKSLHEAFSELPRSCRF